MIDKFAAKHMAYSDLTGRFPYQSSRGNKYVLVIYDYDGNAILMEPLKNRQAMEITVAFNKIYNRLVKHINEPKLFIMDNECSNDLKLSILKNKNTYQLVPPNQHRRNAAEKAIRTFKNHFLSGLATCNSNYPIHEWDRLLPQCELTLNLLRSARANNKLSAWAYLNGNFNFNRTPIAPPGTAVIVHGKPDKRASWAYHGQDGWYIGPAYDHYRCVTCYMPSTRSQVVSDTVKFIPKLIPIPDPTIQDHLRNTLTDLVHLLHTDKCPIPSLQTESAKRSLITIADSLNNNNTEKIINKIQTPELTSGNTSIHSNTA